MPCHLELVLVVTCYQKTYNLTTGIFLLMMLVVVVPLALCSRSHKVAQASSDKADECRKEAFLLFSLFKPARTSWNTFVRPFARPQEKSGSTVHFYICFTDPYKHTYSESS